MNRLLWMTSVAVLVGCVDYDPRSGLSAGLPPSPDEVEEGWAVEEFTGQETTTVDVIVFADTSGSMDEELQTLGETITPFVERLATRVEDWQLAAVTNGAGCSPSGVLTPDSPRYAETFADALVEPGNSDDQSEMGLNNVAEVVERSGRGDCNEGLVRGGALQVLFVTDENEQSPGFDESPAYWREYLDRIVAVHGDASQVQLSAVAGPTPNGCRGADPGFGYDAPVAATGGEYLSICDDWASQIDLIADSVALRSTFPLVDVPVPDTISVWVNDVALGASGFDYDQPTNAVVLVSPVGGSDTVVVEYQVAP
ncbi:MAG: hypothetical protein ABMB14_23080 [Myxococcota bacterium]